jgi:hypothetical protein
MKKLSTKNPTEARAPAGRRVPSLTGGFAAHPVEAHKAMRRADMPPGFSGVMSRVCEMVWPVWPDMASSEHGADLEAAATSGSGGGACGTVVSRHAMLQRTPVAPVDQRRAAYTPI